MLLFYPLCYAAVLLKFTYYAQFNAQEQELLSDYYAFYMQSCTRYSLHVADNLIFIKTVLLECRKVSKYTIMPFIIWWLFY